MAKMSSDDERSLQHDLEHALALSKESFELECMQRRFNSEFPSPSSDSSWTSFPKDLIMPPTQTRRGRGAVISPPPPSARRASTTSNLSNFSHQYAMVKSKSFSDSQNLQGRVLKTSKSCYSDNLIDFGTIEDGLCDKKNDILEIFDPILNEKTQTPPPPLKKLSLDVDPFEYIASASQQISQCVKEPIKEEIVKVSDSPQASSQIVEYKGPKLNKKKKIASCDKELIDYAKMLNDVRALYKNEDVKTNPGILFSPKGPFKCGEEQIVKLRVHMEKRKPTVLSCDINSCIDVIVCQALVNFDVSEDSCNFIFRNLSTEEYLSNQSRLGEYTYIQEKIRLFGRQTNTNFIELVLLPLSDLQRNLRRLSLDDRKDSEIHPEDVSSSDSVDTLNYDHIKILVETVKMESRSLMKSVAFSSPDERSVLKPNYLAKVLQAVKAVCTLLGNLETIELYEACDRLTRECCAIEKSNYSADRIQSAMANLQKNVFNLIDIYSKTFRVDFSLHENNCRINSKKTSDMPETLLVRTCALHRLKINWSNYKEFGVTVSLYHGTNRMTNPIKIPFKERSEGFYECVFFDSWLDLYEVCSLPRESRLVFNIVGIDSGNVHELGWTSLQLFDHEHFLAQGSFVLLIWSNDFEKELGPSPDAGSHPNADLCPLLSVELPEISPAKYPHVEPKNVVSGSLKNLDQNTRDVLNEMCESDMEDFYELGPTQKSYLWERRRYLTEIPSALHKILLSCPLWNNYNLKEIYGLLKIWKPPENPIEALVLLHPRFPDVIVRDYGTRILESARDEELVNYLPQLIQVIKFETWLVDSPVIKFLLNKCLISPVIAHHTYWFIDQIVPKQNHHALEEHLIEDKKASRHKRRYQIFLRSLYIVLGEAFQVRFNKQQSMILLLNEAATNVRGAKESQRSNVLRQSLSAVDFHLHDFPSPLPIRPGIVVKGLDLSSCSYFTSNAVPLKLSFLETELKTLFKIGEDLRQDMFTLQLVRTMNDIWLKAGLDLKIITFACLPTGLNSGMIELVSDAKTLREIQVAGTNGVAGSFKDKSLFDWLEKRNPPEILKDVINNFTRSCAGYSVITYVLGICDRHNDNIMVTKRGHLFHIDFGKFLGDAQMFGAFKRDRVPFVLTRDMVYVINGIEGPDEKIRFQSFVDLCCRSFNLIRKNGNALLNLLELMARSGIPRVNLDAVKYVRNALLPDLSKSEAAATFTRMIEESLSSWFTQWNFFIHNLGQLRFNSEDNSMEGQDKLLSFVNGHYSLKEDGLITSVSVYGIQKRYRPEKHYVFILKVERENSTQGSSSYLFRTYKEFCELDSMIQRTFPEYRGSSSLPKGMTFGRTEIHEVAERRRQNVANFIVQLFSSSWDIKHSNLVYTFFHPMLRDQEESRVHFRKLKNSHKDIEGGGSHLKLSLEYRGDSLFIMVYHARNLKESPVNSYVKMYLHPDYKKETKRKTKIIKKDANPSYMETISYQMPKYTLQSRILYVTVRETDRFQGDAFLGAVVLPLNNTDFNGEEIWYPLMNLNKPC
ncbi:phosphatidylinositol 4-phosphate 3-kinase C2 domain-containing subunit alpha isoform X1 [Lepeophtheirus salmonis]|uniref:phosphatidylinositol 4-phosphate 3-kinase C2 domain-containing subunit alpha isoform X1 n=2 Tax=Lepeophtheirus salmonis TaxID=72036 RepID=UPI001AE17833|nr:phosphatidylinositol 4-phosphate 3-kinase C2 domain-containing subunit alpha-like isoform X1 [Lepeophtheirus salmonis]